MLRVAIFTAVACLVALGCNQNSSLPGRQSSRDDLGSRGFGAPQEAVDALLAAAFAGDEQTFCEIASAAVINEVKKETKKPPYTMLYSNIDDDEEWMKTEFVTAMGLFFSHWYDSSSKRFPCAINGDDASAWVTYERDRFIELKMMRRNGKWHVSRVRQGFLSAIKGSELPQRQEDTAEDKAIRALKQAGVYKDDGGGVLRLFSEDGHIDPDILQHVMQLKYIASLSGRFNHDAFAKLAPKLTGVRDLDLDCELLTDESMVHLKRMRMIDEIYLHASSGSEITTVPLEKATLISVLVLRGLDKLTDDGLKGLENLRWTRMIKLVNLKSIQGACLSDLRNTQYLSEFTLQDMESLTDENMAGLSGIQFGMMRQASFRNLPRVNGAFFEHLSNARGLGSLSLANLSIRGDHLKHLRNFSGLSRIFFYQVEFADDAALYFGKLQHFKEVSLFDCKMPHESWRHLATLNPADGLQLRVDPKLISQIVGLPALSTLEFSLPTVTDADLDLLCKAKNLKYLDLSGQEKITKNAIEKLMAAIPGIDINY